MLIGWQEITGPGCSDTLDLLEVGQQVGLEDVLRDQGLLTGGPLAVQQMLVGVGTKAVPFGHDPADERAKQRIIEEVAGQEEGGLGSVLRQFAQDRLSPLGELVPGEDQREPPGRNGTAHDRAVVLGQLAGGWKGHLPEHDAE